MGRQERVNMIKMIKIVNSQQNRISFFHLAHIHYTQIWMSHLNETLEDDSNTGSNWAGMAPSFLMFVIVN